MATPEDAGSIYSEVRIRLDKLDQDIAKVLTNFDKMEKEVTKSNTNTSKTVTKNTEAMAAAQVAAIAGLTIALKAAIGQYGKTEQALANVRAVSGATAEEFKALEDAAKNAGETTRFTASQSADALYFLASAGFSAKDSIEALDGVLLLAGATQSDLASTASTLTATLSQFKLEAGDASKVANIFAAATANSQANMEKLSSALRQVGPIAGTMGIGLEEVTASLQALFNAGFKGEQAGVALRNALGDLSDESSTAVKTLKEWGISIEEVNPNVVGLTGAIETMQAKGVKATDAIRIFGKESGPQLATLLDLSAGSLRELESAVTSTNAAAEQYRIQNDTLSGSLDRFKSAGEGLSNNLIQSVSPAIGGIVDLGAKLLGLLNKIPEPLKAVGTGAGGTVIGITAATKALALLGITIGTGPLGVIALVVGLGAAIGTLVKRSKEAEKTRLAEQFGEIASEIGYAGTELENFLEIAGMVEKALSLNIDGTFESANEQVSELANNLKISRKEVVDIGLSSKEVTEEMKTQLEAIRTQIIEQEKQLKIKDSWLIKAEKTAEQLKLEAAEEERLRKLRELAEQKEKERVERLNALKGLIQTLDELQKKGAISEKELLEEKIKLREEELSLLLQQALATGDTSESTVKAMEAQRIAIERYKARLEELNSTEEDVTDTKEAGITAREKLEEEYTRKVREQSETRIEQINREEAEALALAEKEGADKSKILEFYANQRIAIANEVKQAEIQAQKDSTAGQIEAISQVQGYVNQSLDLITKAVEGDLEGILDSIGDTIMQIGAQSGSVEIAAVGLALKLISTISDTFTDKGAEDWEKALVAALTIIAGPLVGAISSEILSSLRENNKKVNEIMVQAKKELSTELLKLEKSQIEAEYKIRLKSIEKTKKDQINAVKNGLSDEQKERLKHLGVIEESETEKLDSKRNAEIETLKETLQDELRLREETEGYILNTKLKAIEQDYQNSRNSVEKKYSEELRRFDFTENEKLRLSLGVVDSVELAQKQSIEEISDKTLSWFNNREEQESQTIKSILDQRIQAIDAEFIAEKEKLGLLTEAEQNLIDFKAQLQAEDDARERAETIARIQALRDEGKTAEADLLQTKLDNADKLKALEEEAQVAKEQRVNDLAELEAKALKEKEEAQVEAEKAEKARIAEIQELEQKRINDIAKLEALKEKKKAAARAIELSKLNANSKAEIKAIQDIYNAQKTALEENSKAEDSYRKKIEEYQLKKAVFDRDLAIAQAKINAEKAVSEVPWYESGIFGNRDDEVRNMYQGIIDTISATPLPEFATGGVVLPSAGGSVIKVAENNNPEFVANMGPSGEGVINMLADKINSRNGGGMMTVQIIVDGRQQAQSVVEYINNGLVRLEA